MERRNAKLIHQAQRAVAASRSAIKRSKQLRDELEVIRKAVAIDKARREVMQKPPVIPN